MNTLTPDQTRAHDVLLPFLQGETDATLAVLEGYAGTGKTYLVSRLLGALQGLRIAVAAPTNKAVRVLRDKLVEAGVNVLDAGDAPDRINRPTRPLVGCTCRSIHSLLGLKLKELDNGLQEALQERDSTLRDYDVVVIDECSMLDDFLFQKIVMERGRSHVLFVGDPAQLPPVKLAKLSPVFDRVVMKVRLLQVVRQAEDNPIIRLSVRLRQLIEAGIKATALNLADVLPPLETFPKAALVGGTPETLIEWWISQHEDAPDSDVRIIAYANDLVQRYNHAIHQRLYGATETRFVSGESVVVHTQCAAELDIGGGLYKMDRLITSDELRVISSERAIHPIYPDILAQRLVLRAQDGSGYRVWIPEDEAAWQRQVSHCFAQFRSFKFQAEQVTDAHKAALKAKAGDWSRRGWALQKAFASLRHAYAITCHKSQGSTFDCALVDFSDLARMRDPLEFNRALYVAVTRSREFLALVVT